MQQRVIPRQSPLWQTDSTPGLADTVPPVPAGVENAAFPEADPMVSESQTREVAESVPAETVTFEALISSALNCPDVVLVNGPGPASVAVILPLSTLQEAA